MEIEFSDKEIKILIHREVRHRSVDVLCKFIEGLKERQKRFMELEGEIQSGFELLNEAHKQGLIKTDTYLKIYECLRNPNLPYQIVIKDDNNR